MKKVLAIVGPTAVGKTSLSIHLAKQFPIEIISGDSMQVYKGMDIGTGKVTAEEMGDIPHYMLDIKEPQESFSVAEFKQEVQDHIKNISNREKLPLIVGGTGLYIQSVLYDYDFTERKRDVELTNRFESFVHQYGVMPLYEKLQEIDPEQADKIHPNNYRRVIRALEIYETTGLTMSDYHASQAREAIYDYLIIGLEMERQLLYENISKRVDEMVTYGLIEEVKLLYEAGLENSQAMKAIGYKELLPYLKGEASLEESIQLLKRNSRRYAKRQFTWFKNKMNVEWFDVTSEHKHTFHRIEERVARFISS
ncbi:MAG TPA: tRNA (adenosine(37)-N6)-dimethylallyltransferase MiaA [Pseudogracilibacillus sp.]|nr:tRNA (adenosine(37)-N6)-dimethylallyltransferase MiaA [Pseudogracilibacillus sp.]